MPERVTICRKRVTARGVAAIGRFLITAAAALAFGGCADRTEAEPVGAAPVLLDEAVAWGADLELEENAEVINVTPQVRIDSAGRFIVADPSEAQVRIYESDGSLLHHFGSKGPGPEEFESPVVALRMPSKAIMSADFSGKFVVFDSVGSEVVLSRRLPVGPIFDVDILNDTLVVLAGRLPGSKTPPLLHIWNPSSDTVVRSFFPQPVPGPGLEDAAVVTGHVSVDVRGDTIAAVFSLSDTVYLFTLDGGAVGKVPISFQHFRRLENPAPATASRERLFEWLESFSRIANLFWVPDGTFYIQYADKVSGEQKWRLLRMTRTGKTLFEIRDTPQLLAIGPEGSRFYFVKPGSLTANIWRIATLAPSRDRS